MNAICRPLLFLLLTTACTTPWSNQEQAILTDLRLQQGNPPPDPTNRFADDTGAAQLGHRFFFETRFSSNGMVSCASCHLPDQGFQDGTPLARGVGTTNRRTMPLAGAAWSSWFFWDGRKDSLWSQALGPLESAVEHGGDRVQYVHVVANHHREDYERVFGPMPDTSLLPAHATPSGDFALWDAWMALTPEQQDGVNRVFANIGKAIAAYERLLQPGPARFDAYVDAVNAGDLDAANRVLTPDETEGLRLFIGKARCIECHNGPLFTNQDFANTGVPAAAGLPDDTGRHAGARQVLQDEFNCASPYSDSDPEDCLQLRTLHADAHTLRQFKVPSLRNVVERAPYMHAGQLGTLEAVVDHYDRAPPAPQGETEVRPLHLTPREKAQLIQFLGTLSAPLSTDAQWLTDPREQP